MQLIWSSRIMFVLGVIGILTLIFNTWSSAANIIFFSMATRNPADFVVNMTLNTVFFRTLALLSLIFSSFNKLFYVTALMLVFMSYFSAESIVNLWLIFHMDHLSFNFFRFQNVPDLFLHSSIVILFLTNCLFLITWFIESKKRNI